MQITHTKS